MQEPGGDVYDWYHRGMTLLEQGNPAAAAQLLAHAAEAEPDSRSIREGLARAQFEAREFRAARHNFRRILTDSPVDDYAHFGAGLCSTRVGDYEDAVEHLALAVAMRPENPHYGSALRQARAARDRR